MRHDLDRFASIPRGRCPEREDRFRDVFLDRDRNVLGLHLVRVHRSELEHDRLIADHAARIERERESVRRHDGLLAVAFHDPIHLLRAAGFRRERETPAFQHGHFHFWEPELVVGLHHWADQRLQRLLVLVLKSNPVGRSSHLRDAHLVDVADEIVIVVPAADPQPGRALDVQHGFRGGVELAVDVDFAVFALVRVDDVNPFPERQTGLAPHVGEIAVDVDVRRTAELHSDLAAASAAFVSPADDRRVRRLRPEPRFRAVGTRARGIVGNLVATEDALPPDEVARRTDDSNRRCRPGILRLQCFGLVLHRPTHVQDADEVVRLVEHRLTIGFVLRVGLAPVELDLLPGIALNLRHPHPNAGNAFVRVPLFDLVREGFARVRREAEILPVYLYLAEVEEVLVQANEKRKAFDG